MLFRSYSTEVRGDRMQMLGGRSGGGSSSADYDSGMDVTEQRDNSGATNTGGFAGMSDDDIPF